MPAIAFHFNAPDKVQYACRCARKALHQGARMLIVGEMHTLRALDAMLWQMEPQDFVAHALQGCDARLWAMSPVLLAQDTEEAPHAEVLLNVGEPVPRGFERFSRIIEIVSAHDPQDRQHARTRWRQYQAQGYTPEQYDLSQRNPSIPR